MQPEDADCVVFELADGTTYTQRPERDKHGDLIVRMYQSFDVVSAHVRQFNTLRVDLPKVRRVYRIGDILTIRGIWNCYACAGDGLATTAMRRRILGLWNPTT